MVTRLEVFVADLGNAMAEFKCSRAFKVTLEGANLIYVGAFVGKISA